MLIRLVPRASDASGTDAERADAGAGGCTTTTGGLPAAESVAAMELLSASTLPLAFVGLPPSVTIPPS